MAEKTGRVDKLRPIPPCSKNYRPPLEAAHPRRLGCAHYVSVEVFNIWKRREIVSRVRDDDDDDDDDDVGVGAGIFGIGGGHGLPTEDDLSLSVCG